MNQKEIKKLYVKFRPPKHVVLHMEAVKFASTKLSTAFALKGIRVKKLAIKHAAQLHDLLRVADFRTFSPDSFQFPYTKKDLDTWKEIRAKYGKIGHIKAISGILRDMGEVSLAKLIEKHDFKAVDTLSTWEEKILYYADKRANGDKITTLKERFKEGRKRNYKKGEDEKAIQILEEKVFQLERELMEVIGVLPV